jgi:hypothetical protein
MDLTRNYIIMCEKSTEIQSLWKAYFGDYVAQNGSYIGILEKEQGLVAAIRLPSGTESFGVASTKIFYGDFEMVKSSQNLIWLPRQDQLMDNITLEENGPGVTKMNNALLCLDEFAMSLQDSGYIDTWEKLFLSFVMDNNFKKKWDGENWINLSNTEQLQLFP